MSRWIWEKEPWPDFKYDESRLKGFQRKFEFNRQNMLAGIISFDEEDKEDFHIAVTGMEAFKSSEIEGERLDLPSLIGSIKANFNTFDENPRKSILSMMVDLYRNFAAPLTHETLMRWNADIMAGVSGPFEGVSEIGVYRTHPEPMQIVDSNLCSPKVCYEAVPSDKVPEEMEDFIQWYERTGKNGLEPLPALIRAGLAHLYFVAIHPFEDGNGRISRAIAEKALSEHIGEPTLISLSHAIADSGNKYYDALQSATSSNDVTKWLEYFCETVLEAQKLTRKKLYFAAFKRDVEQKHTDLNDRQKKILSRMLDKDIKGGLSTEKYVKINKQRSFNDMSGRTSEQMAQADIDDLIARQLLRVSSKMETKLPRYELRIPDLYDQAISGGIVVVPQPKKPQKKRPHGGQVFPKRA